ncbi:MAG: hypothetical protein EA381_03330 [Planctomycetaceae bacterium]|nr:MAG: hypothetical protein EA381_03330 [Planctomycetaceae bacterium]
MRTVSVVKLRKADDARFGFHRGRLTGGAVADGVAGRTDESYVAEGVARHFCIACDFAVVATGRSVASVCKHTGNRTDHVMMRRTRRRDKG